MSAFEKAFASARKSGKKVFSFGGKSYNTKLAKGPATKKSTLPKTVKVGPSKAAMPYTPRMDLEQAYDGMAHSPKVPSVKKDASFLPHKEINNSRSAMNDFKQSESRRSSDYSIGKKNAPKVKRAIGKFMVGKAYKD